MDPISQQLMMGAAGSGNAKTYIEDVFSTWLYTGNGSTQTITNGIDLSGKGGLVWIKGRTANTYGTNHVLFDSERGPTFRLFSNLTTAQGNNGSASFSSTGFNLPSGDLTYSTENYVSWTFRKAAKFFDVVTYAGNGSSNRQIAHNLGSVPGCIIVKNLTDAGEGWVVQHRSLTTGNYLELQSTNAAAGGGAGIWNNTLPTSTVFTVGASNFVNRNGANYVAYLFAHDAGGFGDSGNESVVKCGSYTGNGSDTGPVVTLGWEPQWLIVKNTTTAGTNWQINDNMRGLPVGTTSNGLWANLSNNEGTANAGFNLLPTGFQPNTGSVTNNVSGATYIYIAIRRGPMKTPTDASKVFAVNNVSPSSGSSFTTNFPVDMTINTYRPGSITQYVQNRLVGYPLTNITTGTQGVLITRTTWAESAVFGAILYAGDSNTSIKYSSNIAGSTNTTHAFRRAPGFFDAVAYTGTGVARTVSHNLGVVPELYLIKSRSSAGGWYVYHKDAAQSDGTYINASGVLNSTAAFAAASADGPLPTATTISVGGTNNTSSTTYIAYLFASCPGVSKVGSYTGTGTTLNIDCGFTSGARFLLIKRTDSTGDWYVWDTARGIVSGNDPYFLLNSDVAQVTNTDYIDPLSSGFEISSTAPAAINANGGSFIYLAIA